MSKVQDDITKLSPKQRALLELKLKQKREGQRADNGERKGDSGTSLNYDDENLVMIESVEGVDDLLSKFYGRFPWPWQPMKFDYLEDPHYEIYGLNQDVGDYTHGTIPKSPSIWVAGCGTNQALNTALSFPTATVIGSDISAKSLEICSKNAKDVGVTNLEVREESINTATYQEQFDYVVCTGVIHHNADPALSLSRLAAALKPDGVMQMLVYNRYHRTVTSAFQKAIRIFEEGKETVDFESDLQLAKKIADSVPLKVLLEKGFIQYMDWSESDFADLLIQPVEHSYTVESLEDLAEGCGLQMLYPCISLYTKSLASNSWNLEFKDAELQERYDSLPDTRRWQVTNLIMHEKSPMLWFYLKRKDGKRPRKSEKEVCEDFLDTRFERSSTTQRSYIRREDGGYALSPKAVSYPLAMQDQLPRQVLELVDGKTTMREIFNRLNVDTTFQNVNRARIKLTTSAFPYCRAVAPEQS